MRPRAFKGLKRRQVAKLGLVQRFSILVKSHGLKTVALRAFLFKVAKHPSLVRGKQLGVFLIAQLLWF